MFLSHQPYINVKIFVRYAKIKRPLCAPKRGRNFHKAPILCYALITQGITEPVKRTD